MVPAPPLPPTPGPSSANLGSRSYRGRYQSDTSFRPQATPPGAGNYPPGQPEVPPSHLQKAAGTGQSAAGTFAVSFPVRSVDLQGDTAAWQLQSTPRSHVG